MSVEDAVDFEDLLVDWGTGTFIHRGVEFPAELSDTAASTFGARSTVPMLMCLKSDAPALAKDEIVVRKSDGASFTIADIHLDDEAAPSPVWHARLIE